MKVWCYDDAHYWGKSMFDAASKRGHEARMFDSISGPDEGVVFIQMHSHFAVRDYHKSLMQHFATNPRLKLVPNYNATYLFDDKIEQLRQLSLYVPETQVFKSPTMAREFIGTNPALPIVSKSSLGSGARILRSYDDARKEIKLAFSDMGLPNRDGAKHHGYLYWQKYLGKLPYILRVIAVGSQRIVVKQPRSKDRIDTFDHEIHSVRELDLEVTEAIIFANTIFHNNRINFGALDVVKGDDGQWYMLKFTVGWHVRKLFQCKFFPNERPGTDFWEVLLDEIEAENLYA